MDGISRNGGRTEQERARGEGGTKEGRIENVGRVERSVIVWRMGTCRPVDSGNVLHTVTAARQQLSTSAATHSAYSFCHVG